jgi:hypothetical protein
MNKLLLLSLALVFSGSAVADTPVQKRCYDMQLALPKDLEGTGQRHFLPVQYDLCLWERNVVKEGNISTGEFGVSIVSGDFLMKGYRMGAKSQVATMQNVTITYAKDVASLEDAPASERVRVSLGRNAPRPGVYVGQISIGGAVFGLFGQ